MRQRCRFQEGVKVSTRVHNMSNIGLQYSLRHVVRLGEEIAEVGSRCVAGSAPSSFSALSWCRSSLFLETWPPVFRVFLGGRRWLRILWRIGAGQVVLPQIWHVERTEKVLIFIHQ